MARFSFNKRKNNNKITPDFVANRFFFPLVIVTFIFSTTFFYVYRKNIQELNKNHLLQLENQIVQSKKTYLKTAIQRTFYQLDLLESTYPRHKGQSQSAYEQKLKELAKSLIRNTTLADSGYIWVNEILDYKGGDRYAIRAVHPNLPKTEGDTLSTDMKDIKGNTPYLTELNGIKEHGELFFTYWFKKYNSEKISQKLTYAKLYKKYNWVIATGSYLDDVDALIQSEIMKNKAQLQEHNTIAFIYVLSIVILALIAVFFYRQRIQIILQFFMNEVKDREISLKKLNTRLEDMVEKRSLQLIESEQRYQVIFNNNQSVMLLVDPETGQIVDANRAAVTFYGYTIEQLTSLNISSINTLPKEEIQKAIQKAIKSNSAYFIFQHKLASGEIRDVEVYSEKMILNGQERLFSIIHDISELRKTKKELLHAKRKAEESDRLKSAFLANMSHEIRTPLNSILGFTDLLSNPANSREQIEKYTNIINNSGEYLMRIIDDIIDISHLESKQLQISTAPIKVNEIILQIANTFRSTKMKNKSNQLELRVNIPDESKEFLLETDEIRFAQICNNLLGNAIKFTDKGFIEIGYTVLQEDTVTHLRFFVKDSGCGIPKDKFKLVFDRFSQVNTEEYHEGNGLGLSIVKGLVELLGGEIVLESEVGKGSCFYFSLPLIFSASPHNLHRITNLN